MNLDKYFEEKTIDRINEIAVDYFDEITPSAICFSLLEFLQFQNKIGDIENQILLSVSFFIEKMLSSGDKKHQEAVSLSFLEDLTNENYKDIYKQILPYLGEKSLLEIEKINDFWKGR